MKAAAGRGMIRGKLTIKSRDGTVRKVPFEGVFTSKPPPPPISTEKEEKK